jgi:hypothetical protein
VEFEHEADVSKQTKYFTVRRKIETVIWGMNIATRK